MLGTARRWTSPRHDDTELHEEFGFIDDVPGKPLKHKSAVEARRLEMDFFRKMRMYEKAPRWRAAVGVQGHHGATGRY